MTTRGIMNIPAGQNSPAAAISQMLAGRGRESFSSVMNTQLNNTVGNDRTAVKTDAVQLQKKPQSLEKTDTAGSKGTEDVSSTRMTKGGQENISDVKVSDRAEATSAGEVKNTQQVQNGSSEENILSEEEIQVLAENVAAFMTQVAELFSISPEELQEQLTQIGAEPMDLLKPDTLMDLVMRLNGFEDPSELLLDGESTETLAMLNQEVKNFGETLSETSDISGDTLEALLKGTGAMEEATASEVNEKIRFIVNDERTSKLPASERTEADIPEIAETNEGAQSLLQTEAKSFTRDGGYNQSQTESELIGSKETAEKSEVQKTAVRTTDNSASPLESFIQHLEKAAEVSEVQEIHPEAVTMRDIVYQISEQIKVTVTETHQSMEMTLNPESLGKVFMNVTNKSGVMTATFVTENQTAREAIESQLQILKDNIEAQGIKVSAIEVSVSEFGFSQSDAEQGGNTEQQNRRGIKGIGRRNLNLNDADIDMEDLTVEEKIAAEIMEQNGSTVDYTA